MDCRSAGKHAAHRPGQPGEFDLELHLGGELVHPGGGALRHHAALPARGIDLQPEGGARQALLGVGVIALGVPFYFYWARQVDARTARE